MFGVLLLIFAFLFACVAPAPLLLQTENWDPACNSASISETDVFNWIFANYSSDVRPRKNASDAVEVFISVRISGIQNFLEPNNKLILDGYLQMDWHDDWLVWNDTLPYSCISPLVIASPRVWLPDVGIINSFGSMHEMLNFDGNKVVVGSNGDIEFSPAGEIIIGCELDLSLFPFDRQTCKIKLESWSYIVSQQRIFAGESPSFSRINFSWTENKHWEIESNYTQTKSELYVGDGIYDSITFHMVLRRKCLFYYVNVIIPSLIISVVELVTFVLPLSDVVKMHISFTCLLAYSVFEAMILGDMPKSSESVPLLSLYIDLQMSYIGIIAILFEGVVFVIVGWGESLVGPPSEKVLQDFYHIGRWLFVQSKLVSTLCSENNGNKESAPTADESPPSPGLEMAAGEVNMVNLAGPNNGGRITSVIKLNALDRGNKMRRQNSSSVVTVVRKLRSNSAREQWFYIAAVIERINALLYVAAVFLTPIFMFVFIPATASHPSVEH